MNAENIGSKSPMRRKSRKCWRFLSAAVSIVSGALSFGVSSAGGASSLSAGVGSGTVPSLLPSRGLLNMGNTCYLNAQLECAYHVPKVRNLILSARQQQHNEKDSPSQSLALMALSRVFELMQPDSSAPPSTAALCQALGIDVSQQHDSQEFWKLLLPELGAEHVADLYRGSFLDFIAAMDGSRRERLREEPFLDISLDISSGSVVQAMKSAFGEGEFLLVKEGNGWRPDKGSPKVDALKGSQLRVPGLPSILHLHLKRFHFDWATETTSKLNGRFEFPKELDLHDLCVNTSMIERKLALYELHAVVIHVGEFGSGHYYAYVRPDITSDVWYRFDDHIVTRVTLDDVFADSFGGRWVSRESATRESTSSPSKGVFGWLFRGTTGKSKHGSYGWGGSKSCAYMLQYVKKSDVPTLFHSSEDGGTSGDL